jgi:hypothetical protein
MTPVMMGRIDISGDAAGAGDVLVEVGMKAWFDKRMTAGALDAVNLLEGHYHTPDGEIPQKPARSPLNSRRCPRKTNRQYRLSRCCQILHD